SRPSPLHQLTTSAQQVPCLSIDLPAEGSPARLNFADAVLRAAAAVLRPKPQEPLPSDDLERDDVPGVVRDHVRRQEIEVRRFVAPRTNASMRHRHPYPPFNSTEVPRTCTRCSGARRPTTKSN